MRRFSTEMMTVASRVAAGLACAALLSAAPGCASSGQGSGKVQVAQQYAFWPQFPDEPRIQFLRSFGGSEDVAPAQDDTFEKLMLGSNVKTSENIQKPYGVAMRGGRIYVCDIRHNCITVLDLAKKETRLVGVTGINALKHPVDVTLADDGTMYVADTDRGAIFVFDASERFSRVIGHEKFKPVSLAVHGDRLYACDLTAQRVEIFDRNSGDPIGTFGKPGDEDGDFRVPLGIATDAKGDVYVVDMMRCRVQKFSPDGTFISGVGKLGDYAGSFARPKQLAVDSEGILYVVDAAFQNVQMFDDQYQLLMSFGAAGAFPGAMDLPVGIAVSNEGIELFHDEIYPGFNAKRLIVVTNQFGPNKVSVYALGERNPAVSLKQLAAAASQVGTGTDARSPEHVKFQNVGTDEPTPGEGDAGAAPGQPAPPPAPAAGATPAPKPKQPGTSGGAS